MPTGSCCRFPQTTGRPTRGLSVSIVLIVLLLQKVSRGGILYAIMPVTRTAKKALRQNVRRRAKNVAAQAELKKTLKQFKKLVADKKAAESSQSLALVYQKLDKAAKTGLIKKNTANRLKSRLSKRLAVIVK